MALIFTGPKIDPAEGEGLSARRDPRALSKATRSSVAAAAILGWEEAAEGLAAQ